MELVAIPMIQRSVERSEEVNEIGDWVMLTMFDNRIVKVILFIYNV
jgi:hypothetical protein